MASVLDGIVSGALLQRLNSLSQSVGSKTTISNSGASTVSFSKGLRFGAQAFGSAVQNLNGTISFVNLARSTLSDLGKITDEMIALAKEASDSGVSESGRDRLDGDFQKLVDKFRQTVANSEINDTAILTKQGLADLFTRAGLDPKQAATIKKVFDAFVLPEGDDSLASEGEISARPAFTEVSVYTGSTTGVPYRLRKLNTASLSTTAAISTVNSVYIGKDLYGLVDANASPLFTVDLNGSATTQTAGQLSPGASIGILFAVNESTGYSLVKSTEDPLGYNGSNRQQIFLADNRGTIVQQVTDNNDPDRHYTAADLSRDSTVVYAVARTDDGLGNRSAKIQKFDIPGGFFADPSSITRTDLTSVEGTAASGFDVSNLKVSNNGHYLGFYDPVALSARLFKANGAEEPLLTTAPGATVLGFSSDGTIVYQSGNSLYDFTYSSSVAATEIYNAGVHSIVGATVLERDSNFSTLTYFSVATDDGNLALYSATPGGPYTQVQLGKSTVAYSLVRNGTSPTINKLSLAYQQNGQVDIGIVGTLSGEPGTNLYRLTYDSRGTTATRTASPEGDVTDVFDGSLRRRPDAVRTLADLNQLKSQIDANVANIDKLSEVLGLNVKLLQGTSSAFLELSGQVANEKDAESLAQKLQLAIRSNAFDALEQVGNLELLLEGGLQRLLGDA